MIELNTIYTENCLATMARMPSEFVDLVVTSPPYDSMRDYNGYVFDFESIALELARILKPGGVIVWVVRDETIAGTETLTSSKQKIFFHEKCGLNIHDTMLYISDSMPSNSSNRYQNVFEYMFVFSKGEPKTANLIKDLPNKDYRPNGKLVKSRGKDGQQTSRRWEFNEYCVRKNIWYYATGSGGTTKDKFAFEHPAIFPEQLAADHIHTWTNEGDLVYDPMAGSGTTLKMAMLMNRNYIGSEISEEYCAIANKRIALHKSQQRLF